MQDNDLLDEVDENDAVIGTMTRNETRVTGKRHRIVLIMVDDGEGNFLLQKRAPSKNPYPNCWDSSAAGHVDAGEDYDTSAIRELQEEIGLKGVDLQEIMYYYIEQDAPPGQIINRFTKLYIATVPHDAKFVCEPSEVSEVKWATPQEIGAHVAAGDVTDGLLQVYERYIKQFDTSVGLEA